MTKNSKKRNGVSCLYGIVVTFTVVVIAISLSWIYVIINRDPPTQLPAPPGEAVLIIGAETGNGFHAADPMIRLADGEEYIYLESLTKPGWHPVAETTQIRNDQCEGRILNKFEKQDTEIIDCVKAATFGEWCPSPDYYYALSLEGKVWFYRRDYPCLTLLIPLFTFLGILVGITTTVVYTIFTRSRKKISPQPNHHKWILCHSAASR